METINYLPTEERTIDQQYSDLIMEVMKNGKNMFSSNHSENAKFIIGHKMVFDMKNGFPLIIERDFSRGFKGALGEHIAFLNGAQTLEELVSFGCPKSWWQDWVTEKKCADFGLMSGDLGPGSYGPGWTKFPTPDGKFFNQIESIQNQIRKTPWIRTHVIDPWIPYYTASYNDNFARKVVVAPCHGWIRVFVNPEKGTLDILHKQRSADVLVGLASNLVQYAAFGLMLAKSLGYTFETLTYIIEDAHIYERQYEFVDRILSQQPQFLPTVKLNKKLDRIEDYRIEDFLLEDYYPQDVSYKIPTPV